MILKSLVVGPFASNCYIVGSETGQRGMIIDPGAEAKLILKAVNDLGLKIDLIVVTHAHIDHVGALAPVKESTGAKFAIHEAEDGYVFQDVIHHDRRFFQSTTQAGQVT